MPPEGWAGLTGPSPTPAYDLYSVGVVLFEVATLQLPFSGGRNELERAHLYAEPPSPRSLREELPPQLERLILQCLRKDPGQRGSIDTALALLEAADVPSSGAEDVTSTVLARLQEGASTLMRHAAEREAEQARIQAELRRASELNEQALAQLDTMILEAAEVVERNVAPLHLEKCRRPGMWRFDLQHSPRSLVISVGDAPSAVFTPAENAPGSLLLFGMIEVEESGRAFRGANIAGYTRPEAPWVVHLPDHRADEHTGNKASDARV